jgi:hypothetical protein
MLPAKTFVEELMTETFSLYVVDEEALPTELDTLSDQEKYDVLVAAIESDGSLNASIEMSVDDFVDALEAIDGYIEGDRFLPVNAMNNSPYDVLGKNSDCPYFGYFGPGDAQRVFNALSDIPEDTIDLIESFESHSEVFYALRDAAMDAVDAGYALAIVHS